METWNFEYSHMDSSSYPWSSFGNDGANQCPYHEDHDSAYDANAHMDQQDSGNFQVGLFNGVQVTTNKYWLVGTKDYEDTPWIMERARASQPRRERDQAFNFFIVDISVSSSRQVYVSYH